MQPNHRASNRALPVTHAGVVVLLLSGALVWALFSSTSGASNTHNPQHHEQAGAFFGPARLQELLGCWPAPGLAANPKTMDPFVRQQLQFKHYYVSTSTIPGAGLGIFARHDMPKGFIWNVEDAAPGSSMNFTRAQWDSISKMAGAFEAAGVKQHAMYDLVSLIRRYSYYCSAADLMMVSLTGATLTNHATQLVSDHPATASINSGTAAEKRALHLLQAEAKRAAGITLAGTGQPVEVSVRVRNSVAAWPQDAAAAARLATELGVKPPSLHERCVLSRTLRAIKAGEEMLEDYSTYDCPWPGCNSPTVAAVRKAAISRSMRGA